MVPLIATSQISFGAKTMTGSKGSYGKWKTEAILFLELVIPVSRPKTCRAWGQHWHWGTKLWYLRESLACTPCDHDTLSRLFLGGGANWPGQILWEEWISSSVMYQIQDLSETQRTLGQHLTWSIVKENDSMLNKRKLGTKKKLPQK